MNSVIIIGAGGFGMEVLWLAERCGKRVLGFLDDTPGKINSEIMGYPVLGEVSSWSSYEKSEFIVAIGSPRGRKAVIEKMKSSGVPAFATLIDPNAIVGKEVVIGAGSIICAGVICTVAISIGCHVVVNLNSTIGHESTVGDFCTIAPNASISGNVCLESCVEIGTGAKIREKISVKSGSVLGMGSVLVKDLESNKVAVGNPARVIREVG